jgi:hypothetical protein
LRFVRQDSSWSSTARSTVEKRPLL